MKALTHKAGFAGRDHVELIYEWEGERFLLKRAQLKGHLEFLRATGHVLREQIHGKTKAEIRHFLSTEKVSPLLRELLENLLGECTRPYQEAELCHCRVVPTQKVIEAIHYGACTVEEIGRTTSAGTGCGGCRVQSDKLIRHYLKSA